VALLLHSHPPLVNRFLRHESQRQAQVNNPVLLHLDAG